MRVWNGERGFQNGKLRNAQDVFCIVLSRDAGEIEFGQMQRWARKGKLAEANSRNPQ
jgi:hypothetical protein